MWLIPGRTTTADQLREAALLPPIQDPELPGGEIAQAPVDIKVATEQLMRTAHHLSQEQKGLWDQLLVDGWAPVGEVGPPGPPGSGATKFTGTIRITVNGTEIVGDLLGEGVIPASVLPDQSFYWIAEGQGEGGFFLTNALNLANQAQLGGIFCQLQDQNGQWQNHSQGGMTTTSIPLGVPWLVRLNVNTLPIGNLIHHYDPAVDNGIPFRMTVGSISTRIAGQIVLGLQIELVIFG